MQGVSWQGTFYLAHCCAFAALVMQCWPCRLSCGLHLRILAALCNDVSDCTTLRNEITARVEEMNQLQTQFRLRQVEVRQHISGLDMAWPNCLDVPSIMQTTRPLHNGPYSLS